MKLFLNLSRIQKQMIAATADLLLLPITFCFAIALRYDGGFNGSLLHQYQWLIVAAPLISIPIFVKLGLYRAVIRFIDQKIVYVAVAGVTLSVVGLAALAAFLHLVAIARSVFVIYLVMAVLYVVASRFLTRGYLLRSGESRNAIPVAIYGAGQAGSQLAGALKLGREYMPVAFIDDKKELQRATISGTKVYSRDALPALIEKKGVQEVLLAMPSLSKTEQRRILEKLEPLKIKIKITPSIKALVSGVLRVQDIRDIELDDLLGRDPVDPDPCLISDCITGKSVMVTGAGGSIGSELCRQILQLQPTRLILLELSEFALYSIEQELRELTKRLAINVSIIPFLGSAGDYEKCRRTMEVFAVETVYHAAAYKHVPLVEHNPIEGICNNVFGTLQIAKAAMESGVKCFVLISTDKAVRPTNVMGASKRLAEMILQAFARIQNKTRFCMVRFGNVLGSSGSVVPLFRKQIMAGGPITLTHPEITRYFMTIPEAAQLVLQAGAMGEGGDVFVLDMGEPVKIVDLARRMIHLSGFEVQGEDTPDGGIEIRHVGLRPGEKLYEELLIGENVEGTDHPRIMRAQEAEVTWPVLDEFLQRLEKSCEAFDYESVRAMLQHMVKEYAPQCGIEDFIWLATNETAVSASEMPGASIAF